MSAEIGARLQLTPTPNPHPQPLSTLRNVAPLARNRLLEATCTVSAPPPPATRWSAEMRCPQGPRHREAWRDPAPELVRPAGQTPFRRHACANGLAPFVPVSYTHLRAHETRHDLVCRLLLEKKKKKQMQETKKKKKQ